MVQEKVVVRAGPVFSLWYCYLKDHNEIFQLCFPNTLMPSPASSFPLHNCLGSPETQGAGTQHPTGSGPGFGAWYLEVGHTVQIAADELHTQCGLDAVVGGVNADVPGYDWRVEVIFFHSGCIHICKEQLQGKGEKGLLYQWKES